MQLSETTLHLWKAERINVGEIVQHLLTDHIGLHRAVIRAVLGTRTWHYYRVDTVAPYRGEEVCGLLVPPPVQNTLTRANQWVTNAPTARESTGTLTNYPDTYADGGGWLLGLPSSWATQAFRIHAWHGGVADS